MTSDRDQQKQGDQPDTYEGPVWSAYEAARHCSVSRSTLTRKLQAGEVPGATRGPDGGWRIPAKGLAVAGLIAPPSPDDDGDQDDDQLPPAAQVAVLRAQLDAERTKREAAERLAAGAETLAEERAARILDLQQALRALMPPDHQDTPGHHDTPTTAPAPQATAQDATTAPEPAPAAPAPRRGLWGRVWDAVTG